MPNVVGLSDNAGFRAPVGIPTFTPVHGTGGTETDAATGGDHSLTVTAGATYVIMATATGAFLFGLATTATAANVAWFCEAGRSICITIPLGYTALHYQGLVNDSTFYYTKIVQ